MKNIYLQEPFVISNKNSEFTDTTFSGSNLEISHSEIKFIGCKFTGFYEFIASLENSKCMFLNCTFEQNGTENSFVSLIFIESSSVMFENCRFKNNRAPLIEVQGSTVILKEIKMENNRGYAIYSSNSEVKIEKSKLSNNGSKEFSSNHIIMESSRGEFLETTIEGCKSGVGIFARADTKSILNSCIIKSNSGGIYLEENSTITIKNSSFENNILENEQSIELFIDSSSANLENTTITKGSCGIYCQKGSLLRLNRCTVENNKKGICAFGFSELYLKESVIKDNLEPPQIYCEDGKLTLEECVLEAKNGLLIDLVKPISIHLKDSKLDEMKIRIDRGGKNRYPRVKAGSES